MSLTIDINDDDDLEIIKHFDIFFVTDKLKAIIITHLKNNKE